MMETNYAIAKKQKNIETERQEFTEQEEHTDFTDIITNKNKTSWKI